MSSTTADARKSGAGKIALTSLAGSSVEWYDFFIYGTAAALVFPTLFFPKDAAPMMAQLAAFSTFAVGFVARPFGGALFGHFGDRIGRKKALTTAMLMMGVSTTLIGLLPTYATAGALAPLALVLLRFVQGLAVGGQWGGAALFAIENAPPGKRGLYGSFAQIGVPIGVVTANLVFLLVTRAVAPEAFAAWGWRIPFLFSVVLIGLGAYVQYRLEDTPAFRKLQEEAVAAPRKASPILVAFKTYPKEIAQAAGACVCTNGNFYVMITFTVAYATKTLHMPQSTVLAAVLLSALVQIPSLVMFAAASDRFGRRGVFLVGAVLLGAFAFAFFPLVHIGTFWSITLAMTVGQCFIAMMYGPQAAIYAEMFHAEVRYSGASLGYQIGTIFGGALAPIIATALLSAFGGTQAIAVYMSAMCVVSFIAILSARETHRRDIDDAGAFTA